MSTAKVCYYCGVSLTKANRSKEHIPPKMMFKAFDDYNAVTVPSCNLHNSSKSGQDQAIISGFMQSLDEMVNAGIAKYTPNIRKAIKHRSDETFQSTKNTVERRELAENIAPLAYVKFPTINWIRQITAGWVFDAIKEFDGSINWNESIVHSHSWFPEEFQTLSKIEIANRTRELHDITVHDWERNIIWKNGWSPYPGDIYRFFVSSDAESKVSFKHRFYDSFTWYLEFECHPSTQSQIMKQVRTP